MPLPRIEERPRQAAPQTSPPRGEELAHDYSTSVFRLQWDQFLAMRDRPNRVTSDQGSQLNASHNTIKNDSLAGAQIEGREVELETACEFVPAGWQWRNDLAKLRVTASKETLKRTLFKMLRGEDPTPSYSELCAVLATAANMASNQPVALSSRTSDYFMPLTMHQLLLRRTLEHCWSPRLFRTSGTSEPADTNRTS